MPPFLVGTSVYCVAGGDSAAEDAATDPCAAPGSPVRTLDAARNSPVLARARATTSPATNNQHRQPDVSEGAPARDGSASRDFAWILRTICKAPSGQPVRHEYPAADLSRRHPNFKSVTSSEMRDTRHEIRAHAKLTSRLGNGSRRCGLSRAKSRSSRPLSIPLHPWSTLRAWNPSKLDFLRFPSFRASCKEDLGRG